jgi:hypothetical protein
MRPVECVTLHSMQLENTLLQREIQPAVVFNAFSFPGRYKLCILPVTLMLGRSEFYWHSDLRASYDSQQ